MKYIPDKLLADVLFQLNLIKLYEMNHHYLIKIIWYIYISFHQIKEQNYEND